MSSWCITLQISQSLLIDHSWQFSSLDKSVYSHQLYIQPLRTVVFLVVYILLVCCVVAMYSGKTHINF